MDAGEYETIPVAAVARSWANYTTSVIEFNNLMRESLVMVGPTLEVIDVVSAISKKASADQRRAWYNTTAHARHEIDDDFNTLNGHVLMAAWVGSSPLSKISALLR